MPSLGKKVPRSRLTFMADDSQQLPCCLSLMGGLFFCRKQVKTRPVKLNVQGSIAWNCRNSSRGASPEVLQSKPLSPLLFRYLGAGDKVIHSKHTCCSGNYDIHLEGVVKNLSSLLASLYPVVEEVSTLRRLL